MDVLLALGVLILAIVGAYVALEIADAIEWADDSDQFGL